MGNVISALVDKEFASVISNKTRHYKMAAREDTRGTLQISFLCTIKRVVFIVDISNNNNLKDSIDFR